MGSEEIRAIQEAYFDEFKNKWEQTRIIAHSVIASQSSKPVGVEKVLPFSWDKKSPNNNKTTKEDLKRMIEKREKRLKNIK